MRWRRLGLAAAVFLSGCAVYHARPLRKPALAALKAPSRARLRAAASHLPRPLAPLKLDFRKPLTGAELGIISVLANPALRALRARDRVANAQAFNAGLLPDPVIDYAALRPYGPNTAGHTTSLAYGFLWDLSALLTHGATVRKARFHARSVEAQVAWQEWVMANRTRMAAIHLYWLRRERAVTQAVLPLWHRADRMLAADVARGVVTPARFALWARQYLTVHAQACRLARAATGARLALNADLGLGPAARPWLAAPHGPPPPRAGAATLFRRARTHRLDLAALAAAYHSAQQGVLQAVLNQYPQLSLGLAGARNTSGITSAGIQIGLVLPIFTGNRGQIAIARARRLAAFRDYVARLAHARAQIYALRARVASLYREMRATRARDHRLRRLVRHLHRAHVRRDIGLLRLLRIAGPATSALEQDMAIADRYAQARVALQTATGTPWRLSR